MYNRPLFGLLGPRGNGLLSADPHSPVLPFPQMSPEDILNVKMQSIASRKKLTDPLEMQRDAINLRARLNQQNVNQVMAPQPQPEPQPSNGFDINSLMTNPMLQAGLGILQANQPSLTPTNPYAGAIQGLQNAAGYQQQLDRNDMRAQQFELDKQQAARQAEAFEMEKQAIEARVSIAEEMALPQGVSREQLVTIARTNPQVFDQALMQEPERLPASVQEFQYAKGNGYTGSYTQFLKDKKAGTTVNLNQGIKAPAGYMEDPSNPGTLVPIPGGPKDREGGNYEFSEGERGAGAFYTRMQNSNQKLNQLENNKDFDPANLTSWMMNNYADDSPILAAIGNATMSDDEKAYMNYAEDFVTAVLRKESGAVIGQEEFMRNYRKLFPIPGDKQDDIRRKRELRLKEMEAMRQRSGGASSSTRVQGTLPQISNIVIKDLS